MYTVRYALGVVFLFPTIKRCARIVLAVTDKEVENLQACYQAGAHERRRIGRYFLFVAIRFIALSFSHTNKIILGEIPNA